MQTHKPAGALAIKPAYGNCKVANGSTSPSTKKKKTSVWKITLARERRAGQRVHQQPVSGTQNLYGCTSANVLCQAFGAPLLVSAAPGAFHSTKVAG